MRAPRPLLGLVATAALGLPALAGCGGTTTVVAGGPVSAAPPAADDAAARPATAAPAGTAPSAAAAPAPAEPPPDRAPIATTTDPAPAVTAPPTTTSATTATGPEDTGGVLVERPGDFPNGGEAFLLARLDREVARRCTRALADSLTRGAVAGLFCDGREALGAAIHYELFPTRLATEDAYGRYRRANDVPLDAGDCLAGPAPAAGGPPAEGPWRVAGRGAGRAMCFAGRDGRWLVSSHPRTRTLTFLLGDDAGALRTLWREQAAPTLRAR